MVSVVQGQSDTLPAGGSQAPLEGAQNAPRVTPWPITDEALPCFGGFDLVALDIETNGLDPQSNEVLAVAFVGAAFERCFLGSDERHILIQTEDFVRHHLANSLIVTWNGEEFDLPFLKERFDRRDLQSSLILTERLEVGKYGGKLFRAAWGASSHVDIAPMFKQAAASLGIPWSLKPIAKRILGVEPVEVDRSGAAIAALPEDELRRYVSSDARVTLLLAERLVRLGGCLVPAVG
jgi:DNA polymerase elongation subunit (family B)